MIFMNFPVMESLVRRSVLIFLYITTHVHGEIRCYCNEPECVNSSYMCKSSKIQMCYVIRTQDGETSHPRYGCVDTLVKIDMYKNICESGAINKIENNVKARDSVKAGNAPLARCCKEDMCNYNIVINVRSNRTMAKAEPLSPGPPQYVFPHSTPEETNDVNHEKDLWFKAAVIAVPIAGGFILVLLVLLAVRMLRSDTRRHRQFIEFRRERTSLTKAHLYVTDHYSEKVGRTSPMFGEMHNPLCKDVGNIRIKKDGKLYEKVSEKPNVHRPQTPIIIWGKPSHRDFATVV